MWPLQEGMEGNPTTEEREDEDGDGGNLKRYYPQHPLPEEIRSLAKDDTVCKYCGVSYLIHSEMKALEEKLKAAEKELATLRGQEKREQLLKEENAVLQQQKKELEDACSTNTQLLISLNSELQNYKDLLKEGEGKTSEYKNKYMTTLRQFSALSQVVRQQKKELQDVKQKAEEGKAEILDCVQSIGEQMVLIKEKAAIEKGELESRINCLDMEKVVITEANKNLTDRLKSTEEQLHKSQADLEHQKTTLSQLESNMLNADELKTVNDAMEKSLQETMKELEEKTATCRTLTVEHDQYKVQLRSKTSEVNELNSKLKQAEQNLEVAVQKVQLELKSKEGELVIVLKQLKSLENKWRDQKEKESQLAQQSQLSQNETQDLRDNLKRVKGDMEALKAERELMIQAHQNRIEDLRESFKNKMAEAENWPQKLQAAVAAEKTRHMAELKTLEDNLKHNFVLELQIEKDKYNELLKKHQDQEKDRNSQRANETTLIEQKYKCQLEEYQRQLTEARRQAAEREEELHREIQSLKKIISDLQDRLARLDGEDTGKIAEVKSILAQRENDLSEAQSSMTVLEEKIREANEQNQFLQNIVRKECEERFELTEALSEARKELLHLKKPAGGYQSKRGSISSLSSGQVTPPAPEQNSENPLGKLRAPHVPANNINISYSNNNNNSNNGSVSRSSSGGQSASSGKSYDAQLMENRKRIATMMGRRS